MPRINRKGKKNGARVKTKPGTKYVSVCTECNTVVPGAGKRVICPKCGYRWETK